MVITLIYCQCEDSDFDERWEWGTGAASKLDTKHRKDTNECTVVGRCNGDSINRHEYVFNRIRCYRYHNWNSKVKKLVDLSGGLSSRLSSDFFNHSSCVDWKECSGTNNKS